MHAVQVGPSKEDRSGGTAAAGGVERQEARRAERRGKGGGSAGLRMTAVFPEEMAPDGEMFLIFV